MARNSSVHDPGKTEMKWNVDVNIWESLHYITIISFSLTEEKDENGQLEPYQKKSNVEVSSQ